MQSKLLTRWVVSTDCDITTGKAAFYGAEVVTRPDEYARDYSRIELALAHALGYVEAEDGKYDIVVSLQNSNILRTGMDIDNCCEILTDRLDNPDRYDSVMSVVESDSNPMMLYTFSYGTLVRWVHTDIYRRQDYPKFYTPNGCVYAVWRDYLVNKGKVIADLCAPYVMSEWTYLDIHTAEDIKKAEAVLEEHYAFGECIDKE